MTLPQATAIERRPNRKQRRRAEKRGKKPGQRSPGETAASNVTLLASAVSDHKAGNLDRAEAGYRQVLQQDSDDPNALRLLGTLLNAKGRRAEALPPLQKAVEIEPQRYANHNNLAVALLGAERLDEAAEHCHRAIALAHDCPDAHKNLGVIHYRQNRPNDALACFEKVSRLDPSDARNEAFMAMILEQLGRLEEAAVRLERVLELEPTNHQVRPQLAVILIELKRPKEAMAQIVATLDDDPQARLGQLAFERLVARMPPVSYSPSVERILIACFDGKHVAHNRLARIAAQQVKLKYAAQQRIEKQGDGVNTAGRTRIHFDGILVDPLLNRLLDRVVNSDREVEFLLTAIRKSVLFSARQQPDLPRDMLRFLVVLAKQCRHNSYVFFTEDRELAEIETLEREIETDLREARAPSASLEAKLALFAMYRPLHQLTCFARLESMPTEEWSHEMQALIKLALLDPQEEERLKAQIPVLGEISDEVSQAVRSQYEENPYPRWFGLHDVTKMTVGQYLRAAFPWFMPPAQIDEPLNLLVAGSGTGYHPLSVARQYSNVEVMAIDLSRASLAYASRMARELAVTNVTFYQADILGLSSLDRRFPVIECAGVLHHMREPERGLSVLVGLLEPGGVIKLGLYSEIARRDVASIRKRIAELGLEPTARNICSFRRQILRGAESPGTNVADFTDFYDLDSCRDLLFHVQEHRFTIPQLKTLLAGHALEFLGFVFSGTEQMDAYRTRYPEDPEMRDLERWARLEEEQPDLFRAMYQFYCRKPD